MNVLLLTDGIYPFVMGGMQKHSYNLARHLAFSGIQLTLVHTIEHDRALVTNEEAYKELFENNHNLHFSSFCFHFPKKAKFPGHYLAASYQYSKDIVKSKKINFESFDVIYVQGFSGWFFLKKFKQLRSKTIINFHGLEMFQKSADLKSALASFMLRPFVKKSLRRAGRVQSLGGKLTGILLNCGIPSHKVITIPIGINNDWLVVREPEISSIRKFVFIGRNERRKGFFELTTAAKELLAEGYEFELHIIGPFENKNEDPGIFHGKITDEEKIKNLLRACDILICPSYSEGMPTVILEGMASGCAIIASDVGAVSDEVDNTNGWLINPGDVNDLKKKIISALKHDETVLIEMKHASISKIRKQFLWESIAQLTIKHFESLKKNG